MKTQLTQGRRPSQINRNFGILHVALLILTAIMFVLAFSSCATSKDTLKFYDAKKYGQNPVKKNKPVGKQTAWIFRQWGHEGR